MWDINKIIEDNNQVAMEWMETGQKKTEEQNAVEIYSWALTLLKEKMSKGPPSLRILTELIKGAEVTRRFRKLIEDYLPSKVDAIMSEPLLKRISKFRYYFAERYYPLPDKTDDIEYFTEIMPVNLMGLSYSVYHDMSMRTGYLALLSLVVYPYQYSERSLNSEGFYGEEDAGRIPLLAAMEGWAGAEVARRIPTQGWDAEFLHKATDDTQYDGLGGFADWALGQTGCAMLDFSYADCSYEEGSNEPYFKWCKNNVDRLAQEWPRMYTIRSKIDRLVEQVEYSTAYFAEMVDYLLSKTPTRYKSKYSYDEDDHYCDLETAREGEEEDECEDNAQEEIDAEEATA